MFSSSFKPPNGLDWSHFACSQVFVSENHKVITNIYIKNDGFKITHLIIDWLSELMAGTYANDVTGLKVTGPLIH